MRSCLMQMRSDMKRSFNPVSFWETTLRTHKYNKTVPILEVRKPRPRAVLMWPR